MNNPFNARVPTFDAAAIHATIERALASAGLDTRAGPMAGVTETIQRALAAAGLHGAAQRGQTGGALDAEVHEVSGERGAAARADGEAVADAGRLPGRFTSCTFSNQAGSRAYKLYVPAGGPAGGAAGGAAAPRAMVVMLHGCTQSADDFAAGTQMNRLADAHDLLVVYPEQTAQANPSKCWNWFQPQDQVRGAGEPAVIAGIVRAVAQQHGADPQRIFVAGLSAGAAMAVTLGETHPELFAAVGAHSGLPHGSAHDIPSALAAMKGGRSGMPGLQRPPGATAAPRQQARQAVPVIVFHGDRDHTVQQTNGAQIVQQAADAHAAQAGGIPLRATAHDGVAPGGRRFRRTVHADAAGQARIEHWVLQGAGHAWSGGDASGSYTDGAGPDASAEMLRFFLALPRAGAA